MKKLVCCIISAILSVLLLSGCGGTGTADRTENTTAGVTDVIESGMKAADAAEEGQEEEEEEKAPSAPENEAVRGKEASPSEETGDQTKDPAGRTETIDVDLTEMSSTMVYSEVYSMLATPEDYIGKTVKMNGIFNYYHDVETGNYYFACIIRDATACCSQGIEFVWAGEHAYPRDYPPLDTMVTVTGTFGTYEENGYTYLQLDDADVVWDS